LPSVSWWLEWEQHSRGRGTRRDELRRHRLVTHVARLGRLNRESKVLSVAPGSGYYDLIVQSLVRKLVCVDLDSQALKICKTRKLSNLVRADALCLPFRQGIFDCAYALSLSIIGSKIANNQSRIRSISELKRVTKVGGTVVIGHPMAVWIRLNYLLQHIQCDRRFFVSPSQVKNAYRLNKLRVIGLVAISPIRRFRTSY
jgi:ubiquinone/menaquinone biosynthesis C-methylase UbiE